MRILKPIIGGDAHHRRVSALRTISDHGPATYDRYEQTSPGVYVYVLADPRIGEIPLERLEAEMYAAGYAAGLIQQHTLVRDVLAGLLTTPLPDNANVAYYGTTARGRTALIAYQLPELGAVLMRRDHAATFLVALLAGLTDNSPETTIDPHPLTDLYQQLTLPPRELIT